MPIDTFPFLSISGYIEKDTLNIFLNGTLRDEEVSLFDFVSATNKF